MTRITCAVGTVRSSSSPTGKLSFEIAPNGVQADPILGVPRKSADGIVPHDNVHQNRQ